MMRAHQLTQALDQTLDALIEARMEWDEAKPGSYPTALLNDAISAVAKARKSVWLTAAIGEKVNSEVGPLTVCSRNWPSVEAFDAGLPPDGVVATQDGRDARRDRFCTWTPGSPNCDGDSDLPGEPQPKEVYYSTYNADGTGAHGWVCSHCRCLTQTG